MEDGKAKIDQSNCLGCGRCERVCQNDAISITLDDVSSVEELIARIESYVEVS
jgi:ferredoxin